MLCRYPFIIKIIIQPGPVLIGFIPNLLKHVEMMPGPVEGVTNKNGYNQNQ